ncbi:MAG TPA: Nudix family hydrolase [Marinagarivorans sp.]
MSCARSRQRASVHVAVGVIIKDNHVLLARRAKHQHQGGLWEFPGGKVEDGERVSDALVRELHEELAITATSMQPLIQIHHDYGDKTVLLDVWTVSRFDGCPTGCEGQPIEWVDTGRLNDYAFPAANQPIVSAITLPSLIAITPSNGDVATLKAFCHRAVSAGAAGIYLRSPHLSSSDCAALLTELSSLPDISVWLSSQHIWSSDGQINKQLLANVDGVNFPARDVHRMPSLAGMGKLLTASCHSLDEIARAEQAGAHAVYISPICPTASHPGKPSLGWAVFSEWVAHAKVPAYALGGMTLACLATAKQHYGQGVAGISLFAERPLAL